MNAYAAAAAAAEEAKAIKASGAIVQVVPEQFLLIIEKSEESLVVHADGFRGRHRYLSAYRGLVFFTKTREPLQLPGHCETIEARKIWIPS